MADGLVEIENRKGSGGCFALLSLGSKNPFFSFQLLSIIFLQNPKLNLLEISFDPSSS